MIANPIERGANFIAGSFKGSVDYIRGLQGERPVVEFTRGLFQPQFAAAEMAAVAATSSRCKDPVAHWIVSWTPAEVPSDEDIRVICEALLADLGMAKSQYLIVVHGDTDNRHAHIVANRVVAGKAASMTYSIIRATQSIARLARARGWDIVKSRYNEAESRTQAIDRGLTETQFTAYWGSNATTLGQWTRREPGKPHLTARELAQIDKGRVPFALEFGADIAAALASSTDWASFEKALETAGVSAVVEMKTVIKSGKILSGVRFCTIDGERGSSGSKLSAPYKVLAQKFGPHPVVVAAESAANPPSLSTPTIPMPEAVRETDAGERLLVAVGEEPASGPSPAGDGTITTTRRAALDAIQAMASAAVDRRLLQRRRARPDPWRRTSAEGKLLARIRDARQLGRDPLSVFLRSAGDTIRSSFGRAKELLAATPAAVEAVQTMAAAAVQRRIRERRKLRGAAPEFPEATPEALVDFVALSSGGSHEPALSLRDSWLAAKAAHRAHAASKMRELRDRWWGVENDKRTHDLSAVYKNLRYVEIAISVFLPRSIRYQIRRRYRAALRRKADVLRSVQKKRWRAKMAEIKTHERIRPAPTFPQFLVRRAFDSDVAAAVLLGKIDPDGAARIQSKIARQRLSDVAEQLDRVRKFLWARLDQQYGASVDAWVSLHKRDEPPFFTAEGSLDNRLTHRKLYRSWAEERALTLHLREMDVQQKTAVKEQAALEINELRSALAKARSAHRDEMRGLNRQSPDIQLAGQGGHDFEPNHQVLPPPRATPEPLQELKASVGAFPQAPPPSVPLQPAPAVDSAHPSRVQSPAPQPSPAKPDLQETVAPPTEVTPNAGAAPRTLPLTAAPGPVPLGPSAPSRVVARTITADEWIHISPRDKTLALFAYQMETDGWTPDSEACVKLMTGDAMWIGARAVVIAIGSPPSPGSSTSMELDLLNTAPNITISPEEQKRFWDAGAENISRLIGERLSELERGI